MNRVRSAVSRVGPNLPAVAGVGIPFVLILGLALESGGYGLIARSQFGIVAWWVILLGAAAGLLPLIRVTARGWLMLGLLGALTAWTALAMLTWTQSTENSVTEFSRTLTMLGFLGALLLLQGKQGLRRSVSGLGAATVVIAVIALLSRYHPDWFTVGEMPEGYPIARLNYPLGYWNGLGSMMVVGLPALVWAASQSRRFSLRAFAAASIPLLVLVVYMTASRGGFVALAITALVLIALFPRRIEMFVSLIPSFLGILALIFLLVRRPELRDNTGGPAEVQGVAMTWLTLAVFGVIAGMAWLVQARVIGRWYALPRVSRELTSRVGAVVGVGLAVVVITGLATGFVGDRWNEFKQPVVKESTVNRLASVSSGERYQYWVAAVEAGKSEPLTGTGPGTFEYWWARTGGGEGFVRDAHSLYLEGFAELGIPGFLLFSLLVLIPIGFAVKAAARPISDERRPLFAAAAAGMVAFAIGAGIDWSWEMTVLPAAFFVYVAAVSGADAETRPGTRHGRTFRTPLLRPARRGVVVGAIFAVGAIAVAMAGPVFVSDSQSAYRAGGTSEALDDAQRARKVNPWSASAAIQVALLQVELGNLDQAFEAAEDATRLDPYSWKAWWAKARAAELHGRPKAAEEALRKVDELNRRYLPAEAG